MISADDFGRKFLQRIFVIIVIFYCENIPNIFGFDLVFQINEYGGEDCILILPILFPIVATMARGQL